MSQTSAETANQTASCQCRSLRVIVIGGGIGGLGVAIGLRRRGHEVVVLERASRLDAVGAGITLFANAINALDRLGVADAVRAAGATARHSEILTSDGRRLSTLPGDLLDRAVAVHRGDLQAILLEAAGEVRLGAAVASVQQTAEGVVASAADGRQEHGDLLIAADGLGSLGRAAISDSAPRYGGYTAWRGVSPVSVAAGRLSESWGVGERFGLVDIGSRTYWFATANTPEGAPEAPGGRKANLMERFRGWHAPIATVLEATPDSAILRNDVYFLEPLPRWSEGRIVLVGDAAHATTPGVGQGAAQALEDAVVLSDEIAQGRDVPAALTRYESIRRPRAELTLRLSRRTDRAAQLANPLGCRLRNALVRYTPPGVQRRALAQLIHH